MQPGDHLAHSGHQGKTLLHLDHFLEHGIHRYVLTYRMSRMVGFFEDYDEIYWNATGNAWSFPIERAEARRVQHERRIGARRDAFERCAQQPPQSKEPP